MTDCAPAQAQSYFLSYSRSDQTYALRLAKDLRAQDVAVWVDQLDIRPSEHWDRAIERAVRCCRGLIVILSPRSVASDNVADEISYAIGAGKPVMPIMIEWCDLPLRITRMHVIDATGPYDKALQQVLAELKRPQEADGPKVEAAPAMSVKRLDAGTIAAAKKQLVAVIGPIAGMIVDKAAARAASEKDLYGVLSQHIDDDAARHHFLALAGHAPAASVPAGRPAEEAAEPGAAEIPSSELEKITAALTRYVGPIAAIVAKKESRNSTSASDLRQRLAALIPEEGDRAEFLKLVEGEKAKA